jgi:hypothetical protein
MGGNTTARSASLIARRRSYLGAGVAKPAWIGIAQGRDAPPATGP